MVVKPSKVVFDTNIFVSAILFGGNPKEILEIAKSQEIQLITSREILLELAKKLHEKFAWNQVDVKDTIEGIGIFAKVVRPIKRFHKIKQDPSDNKVLECAREGSADFIISGDKRHILPLKRFGRTRIVSATEFLRMFESN